MVGSAKKPSITNRRLFEFRSMLPWSWLVTIFPLRLVIPGTISLKRLSEMLLRLPEISNLGPWVPNRPPTTGIFALFSDHVMEMSLSSPRGSLCSIIWRSLLGRGIFKAKRLSSCRLILEEEKENFSISSFGLGACQPKVIGAKLSATVLAPWFFSRHVNRWIPKEINLPELNCLASSSSWANSIAWLLLDCWNIGRSIESENWPPLGRPLETERAPEECKTPLSCLNGISKSRLNWPISRDWTLHSKSPIQSRQFPAWPPIRCTNFPARLNFPWCHGVKRSSLSSCARMPLCRVKVSRRRSATSALDLEKSFHKMVTLLNSRSFCVSSQFCVSRSSAPVPARIPATNRRSCLSRVTWIIASLTCNLLKWGFRW